MLKSLIDVVTKYLNMFPRKGGISTTMGPSMILEGKPNLDMNIKRITVGSYDLVYIQMDNNMKHRIVLDIALHPSNEHGGN